MIIQKLSNLRKLILALSLAPPAFMISTLAANGSSFSQETLRIAATVNDEMISVLDIQSRLTLAIYLSKMKNNGKNRQRLAPQILRSVIDERIKLQDIRKNKIAISQAEIIKGIAQWEKNAGLKRGGTTSLAKKLGIDKAIISEQVEMRIGWIKLIRKLYLKTISINEKEIGEIVSQEISKSGEPEYLVSEIFLPIDKNSDPEEVKIFAERLIEQIAQGAKFSAIARNFSQSPTAAVNGNLGWLRQETLPQALIQTILSLQPQQVSKPVTTIEGIYILKLLKKRAFNPLQIDKTQSPKVIIQQIHFELPPQAKPKVISEVRNLAVKVSSQANSCKKMEALGQKFGSSRSGSSGSVRVNQLSPKIQSTVDYLPVGKASDPLKFPDGFVTIMICERGQGKNVSINESQLRNNIINKLTNERMNLAARQYIRSLRRTAVIDIRL